MTSPSAPLPRLSVIHHQEHEVVRLPLLPLPPLPAPSPGPTPLQQLTDNALCIGLLGEWLRLALQGALTSSLSTEHRWRLNQMQRADQHLEQAEAKLLRKMQRQRQTEITIELETLMSALDVVSHGA